MTTDKIKTFWFGLFVIMALLLAAWLMLFLKPSIGNGRVLLTVRCSNIDKISVGTRVAFAGKPVGEVIEIKEAVDPRGAPGDPSGNLYIYELILRVDSSVHIYVYDEIVFATAGLLGEKSIAINPRAAPLHSPLPREITEEVLFARSTDKVDEMLNTLTTVAGTFNDVLTEMSHFISNNNQELHTALQSFHSVSAEIQQLLTTCNEQSLATHLSGTMEKAELLLSHSHEKNLIERLGNTCDSFHSLCSLCSTGEGTLPQLMQSNSLYVQLTTILCQLQTVLNDINNYGLLYQFNRKWQRMRNNNGYCTEMPDNRYFKR
jgi:phospholipid/cholesterol/gamma-HCH transport system substrate-binding protein